MKSTYLIRMRYLKWYVDLYDAFGRITGACGPYPTAADATTYALATFPTYTNGDI